MGRLSHTTRLIASARITLPRTVAWTRGEGSNLSLQITFMRTNQAILRVYFVLEILADRFDSVLHSSRLAATLFNA